MADVNGDGLSDLITFTPQNGNNLAQLTICFGQKNGTMSQPVSANLTLPNGNPGQVLAGDFNCDRESDLHDQIGTRYMLVALRTLVDPENQNDIEQVHALQDAIRVEQENAGKFEVPNWDSESQKKIREALLVLGSTLPDSKGMFGNRSEVDPVRRVIGPRWLGVAIREKKRSISM